MAFAVFMKEQRKKQRNKFKVQFYIGANFFVKKKTKHYIHILGSNIAVLICLNFLNGGGDIKITINLIQEDPEIY